MENDLPEVDVEMTIPFHDLDPAKMVWFGNYYKYFDRARTKLMCEINYGMEEMLESGFFWPVIESKCRHIEPLEINDRVNIHAEIDEYERRLKIYYLATRPEDDERIAKGHTVQVAVDIETGQMHLDSPPVLFEKLGIPDPDRSNLDSTSTSE